MRFFSNNTVSKFALAGLFAVASAAAQAQTTGSLNVSATVQATCVIDSIDTIAFGTYVQGAGNVTSTGNINLNCGTGISYNVRLSGLVGIANRTMAFGANSLQYQLYRDNAYSQLWGQTDNTNTFDGTGTGASVAIPVYGRIVDGGPNLTAVPGLYTSVVTVTVNY
jgi:spore coat protein U-like protein